MKIDIESLASALHDIWVSWAKTLLKEETLSEERTMRWQILTKLIYCELDEDEKQKDRDLAEWLAKRIKFIPVAEGNTLILFVDENGEQQTFVNHEHFKEVWEWLK